MWDVFLGKGSSMRRRATIGGWRGAWRVPPHPMVSFLLLFACGLLLANGVGPSMEVAGAAPPPTVVTLSPNPSPGPFLSGQLVKVGVAPNTVLRPGAHLTIEECSAASVNKSRAALRLRRSDKTEAPLHNQYRRISRLSGLPVVCAA